MKAVGVRHGRRWRLRRPECSNILAVTDEADPYPKQAALIKQNLEPLGLTLNVKSFERTTMYAKCNDPARTSGSAWRRRGARTSPTATRSPARCSTSVSIFPRYCNYALVGADSAAVEVQLHGILGPDRGR